MSTGAGGGAGGGPERISQCTVTLTPDRQAHLARSPVVAKPSPINE
jgi:hypothetical protein